LPTIYGKPKKRDARTEKPDGEPCGKSVSTYPNYESVSTFFSVVVLKAVSKLQSGLRTAAMGVGKAPIAAVLGPQSEF